MADEPDPDTEIWGKDDLEYVPRPKPSSSGSGRWIVLAIVVPVGLVMLAGLLMWVRTRETARMQADMERRMELEAQLAAEEVAAKRAKAVEPWPKHPPQFDPPPKLDKPEQPLVLDPGEALRTIAIDPEALNKLGLFLLKEMDDPEEAIQKFREAAKLDPKYEPNVELARKRQIQKDHTAPRPRELD